MKWCEHCKLKINTDRNVCPLCFNSLKEVNDGQVINKDYRAYPSRKDKKRKPRIAYKIFLFLCIISVIVSAIINFTTHKEGGSWWCLYVLFGVLYIFTLVRGTILSKIYIIKRLVIQEIVFSILIYLIDRISGDIGWSIAIVIPAILVSTNMANSMIMMINRKHFGDGFAAMLFSLLLGCIPFILQLFNVITDDNLWAPLVSGCFSVCVFAGIFVFGGRRIKEELHKRLHV